MIGNYLVPGNVMSTKYFSNPNSEYNSYLDPFSFQNVIDKCKEFRNKLEIVPLNQKTMEKIYKKSIYQYNMTNIFIKNIFNIL